MKSLKYLVAALVVLALAVTIAYQRRDSIARDIANSLLGETNIRIVDVDLDALLASRVTFGHLEIELADGSRLRIEDLNAPLSFPSLQPEYVAIRTLRLRSREPVGEPKALAPAVRAFFELPRRFPRAALTVETVLIDDYPEIGKLVWNLADELQRLHFSIAGFVVRGEAATIGPASYRTNLAIDAPDRAEALTLDVNVIDEAADLQLSAYGSANTASFAEPLRGTGFVPNAVHAVDGTLYGSAGLRLDDAKPGSVSIAVKLATDGNLAIRTDLVSDQTIEVNVSPGTPADLRLQYPEGGWTIRAPRSTWTTDLPGLELMQLRLTDLECDEELLCTFDLGAGPAPLTLAELHVERALFTIPVTTTVTAGESVTAELLRDPSVFLSGIRFGSVALGSVTATRFDGSTFSMGGGGVSGNIDSLSLNLTNLAADGVTADAVSLQLSDIVLQSDEGIDLSASMRIPARSGTLAWRDYSLRNPQIDGSLTWNGKRVGANVSIAGGRGALAATAVLQHDLETRSGALGLSDGELDFAQRSLSEWLPELPDTYDVLGGRIGFDGRVEWRMPGDKATVAGRSSLALGGLLARYRDIAATGIGGDLAISLNDGSLQFGPSDLSAALVDVGFPLEELSASFRSVQPSGIAVDSLTARLLGGGVRAEPFVYTGAADETTIVIRPESIQLPFIARLAGFDKIKVEGSVSGEIPILSILRPLGV